MGPGKLASVVAAAWVLAAPFAHSQRPNWRAQRTSQSQRQPLQQRAGQHPQPQQHASQQNAGPRPQNQPGHAGNWLRRYKELPPDQQRRALENDPGFRKLPPWRQAQLQRRLQRFSSLPPHRQEQILNRMETWEHLTPVQKMEARTLFHQFQALPPHRRPTVNRAINSMRSLTPEQREQLLSSDSFKHQFTPQELNLLRGASRLPLAPEGLQGEPPEE